MKPVIWIPAGIVVASLLINASVNAAKSRPMPPERMEKKLVAQHIAVFDDLDFNVFTKQKWEDLGKSHSPDVIVHWPDGHTTKGLEKHTEDLKAMFTYAPDTRIQVHPVKFGADDWTSVIGLMEGTFTRPMPFGEKMLAPTDKAFRLSMATIGHWNKDGVMDEEYLFWDNQTFMKQVGLGQ